MNLIELIDKEKDINFKKKLIKNIIKSIPDNLFYLKYAEFLDDEDDEKYETLQKVIDSDNHAWANIFMIKLFEKKEDIENIIKYVENLKTSISSDRWKDCEATKKEAYEIIKRNSTDSWEYLEKLAKKQIDKKEAAQYYKQAINLAPEKSHLYVKLAEITDDLKEKFKLLENAIEIDNNIWANIITINLNNTN
jgi:tetratricopeptide (TPR) repeat protein